MGNVAPERLIIDFWDVGQGDCSIITLPDGKLVVIDVGPRGSPCIEWIEQQRLQIHSVVITHNDADHIGSLPSLVKTPGITIENVFLLQDRDKKSTAFQTIFRPVREEELKKRFKVKGLTSDTIIWAHGQLCLKVVFPSFSEAVEARAPNQYSAVICLFYKGDLELVWPGDAPFRVLAEKCAGGAPTVLNGPHHGAPVDRKSPQFRAWVDAFMPETVFISVGTENTYDHPVEAYLSQQSARGCRVVCSQLTRICDNRRVLSHVPVMQGAMLLGLPAPKGGVSCRGSTRLTFENGVFTWDA